MTYFQWIADYQMTALCNHIIDIMWGYNIYILNIYRCFVCTYTNNYGYGLFTPLHLYLNIFQTWSKIPTKIGTVQWHIATYNSKFRDLTIEDKLPAPHNSYHTINPPHYRPPIPFNAQPTEIFYSNKTTTSSTISTPTISCLDHVLPTTNVWELSDRAL